MDVLLSVTLFTAVGAAFVFINLFAGWFARPWVPNPEKAAVYECGEPTIGSSWVQFDLRFYIVALVYLIFVLAAQSLVLAPVVVALVAPAQSARLLDTALAWLERNNRVITIAVSLIFGVWFVWKGVTGLTG